MKYIIISRLVPGTEAGLEGFKVFSKLGNPPGADATWAGVDGKTFVVVTDEPDLERALAYSPFFQDVTVIPVVPLDDAYVQTLLTVHGHWGATARADLGGHVIQTDPIALRGAGWLPGSGRTETETGAPNARSEPPTCLNRSGHRAPERRQRDQLLLAGSVDTVLIGAPHW